LPAAILRDLGIKRVRLLSNNPRKVSALAENGIEVVQLTCEAPPNPQSLAYLQTKKEKMGHALSHRNERTRSPCANGLVNSPGVLLVNAEQSQ
jgi:3,4-dihydroxy 2-butanone 4-phosphate synthase / GTP cyclohydrolase II